VFGVLEELETAIDKAAACEEPLDAVRLRRLLDRAESVWVHAVGHADRDRVWVEEGFVSCASWLREQCRLDHNHAASTVKLARTLRAMPLVAEAFAAGEISRQHAQAISYGHAGARADAFEELDETFADAARKLRPYQLRKAVQYITDSLDGDGGRYRDRDQYARRRFHLSNGLDGMAFGDLVLEPEGKELLETAINSAMASDRAAHDLRSHAQRRYDALIDVIRAGLAHLPDGPGRHNPAHVSAIYDVRVFEETNPVLAATMRCEAAYGPISRSTLERWACDCKVSRIIVDGDGEVLDVGRSSYTATPAQWRALVVRDGGCVEPGCDRPSGWCDVHHKQSWEDGGETNLDNLELRCRRHHRRVHGHGP
jgi:hypothetical protein